MVEIIKNLWVGNDQDTPEAQKRGYAICSCPKEGPSGHRSMLGYTTLGAPKGKDYYFVERGNHIALNLIDVDDPNFIPEQAINAALKFIKKHFDNGEKILIHCNRGHSRGPTVALMFMRSIGEMPHNFVQSLRVFKTLYPEFDPGQGMKQYARSHWASLETTWQTTKAK